MTLAFVLIFLLGTIIGSFLNVVIYRFNTGKSIVRGRSICMTCNKNLRWYELIPVLSFLVQSGRCRRCATRISHQYPLVEFGTGLVFVLIALFFSPILITSSLSYIFLVTFYSFIFSLLIVIAVYDAKHTIIPDKLVYTYAFFSFLSIFINYTSGYLVFNLPSLISVLSGPLFALPFALIWVISRGKWMGLGDAKLILGIGWMLGPLMASTAIILAFWGGALVSLFLIIFSKKIKKNGQVNMKTEVPLAPFLILGTLIVFILHLDILQLSRLFMF